MPSEAKHDYHLVEPSPWPLVGSLSAFVMLVGAVLWLNKSYAGFGVLAGIPWIFAIGFAMVLYTMAGWWRDVVLESVVRREHTPVVKLSLRYGMVLFIAAEVMFFVTWFWATFHFSLFPNDAGISAWPPKGIVTFDPWHFPLLATVILLTSGATVTWAHHALQQGDKTGAIQGLLVTVLLGLSFIAIQAYEFAHAPFSFGFNGLALVPLSDPAHSNLAVNHGALAAIYGSTFFLATGFLSLHVMVATVFLAVCLGRVLLGHFTPTRHFGFEAATWYWRFVVVTWLALFIALYVCGQA